LNATQVAAMVGTSVQTINLWYRFKKENPKNELAKLLPKYKMTSKIKGRCWKKEDVWKILEFKSRITKGRNGQLGSVTQKYHKKKEK